MANDCAIRRLKAVVNNSDLMELGTIRLVLRVENNYIKCYDHVWDDINGLTIKLLDDDVTFTSGLNGAVVVDSKNGTLSTSQQSQLNLSGVPSNKLINVEVNSKYGIVIANIGGGQYSLEDFIYFSDRLASLDLSYVGINGGASGNISVLENKTNLQAIRLQYNKNVFGNITAFGECTLLVSLSIGETGITGNWIDFVNAQKVAGRTSCNNLSITMAQWTNVYFGNLQEYPRFTDQSSNAVLKWEDSKVAFENSNIKKVYLYGYTNAEAQEYINQGYTVVIAD